MSGKVNKKKKKNNAFSVFLKGFTKALLILSGLVLTGFISYKGTLLYYNEFGGPKKDKSASAIREMYGDVKVEDISKNLIYALDEDHDVKAMVIEIFNRNTRNMDYITIPLKTKFTISNELFQKLFASKADAPQIIKLSEMDNYFKDDTLFEYGVILLEDLLDIDINYYTAVPYETFKEMFKKRESTPVYAEDGTPIHCYYEWKIKSTYKEKVSAMSKEEMEKYIKETLKNCTSNLSVNNKMKYLEGYQKMGENSVFTHSVYGELTTSDYIVRVEETNQLIQTILSNTAYTAPQKKATNSSKVKLSLEKNIEILNGSQISGLAAHYQTALIADGYTISGIGNYSGNVLAQTKILIREEGIGTDLLTYFSGAVVELSSLAEGVDIQIVLGTDADIQ